MAWREASARWLARRPAWLPGVALAAGIVFLGLLQEDVGHDWDGPVWIPILDLAIGWTAVACGLVSMWARPRQPAGLRLVIVGFLSFELGFRFADDPWVSTLAFAFGNYNDLAFMVLALSFPDRQASWRPGRIALNVTASLYLLQSLARLLYSLPDVGGPALLPPDPANHAVAAIDIARAAAVLACGLLLAYRLGRMPAAQRRSYGLVLGAGVATALASATNARFALTVFGVLPRMGEEVVLPLSWAINVVRIAVPLAILVGVLRAQQARSALVGIVRDVGPSPSSESLRDALATALGDPALRLLTRDRDTGEYRDRLATLSAAEVDGLAGQPGLTLAPVFVDGERVAVLVLSGPPLDEGLIDAGVALTGLVVQNQRLASLVQEQLATVRASRARLVEATDRERRRIERDLHDGLQQRMVALAIDLRGAQADLEERTDALQRGADEVLAILQDVRELARGIHPAILTEAGLAPAIRAAADRSPIPVDVDLRLSRERSAAVTATAYFVASEALANVAKHAGALATAAWVTADDVDGLLRVVIEDDGAGGADPRGHGLAGLADRVAALDGSFTVGPRAGGGTRVEAVLPLR